MGLVIGKGVGVPFQLGSKLKPSELPEGEYLVTVEGEYMTEEDNTDNLLIEQTPVT